VNIINFPFDKTSISTEPDKYASYVQLIDRETHKLFYDKMTFVYIELPKFAKELDELKTFFEQWIYIIGHLHEMKDVPASFPEEIFGKLFEEAKIARMTKKEKDNYYTSLKNLRDMNIAQVEIGKLQNNVNIAQIEIGKMSNALLAMKQENVSKDNIIATMIKESAAVKKESAAKDNIIASVNKALEAQEKEIAELRRRLGVN
jgi:predicted RNase H-like nuclease (RuvC/YqgF family)